jgi:hypothetical protein
MTFLDRFFGPTREEVWQRLAEELGGSFDEGAFWVGGNKVRAQVGKWLVTLDVFKDERRISYTRLRAPLIKSDLFVFSIVREGQLKHHQDSHDLPLGQIDFDPSFTIRSNNIDEVQKLFSDEKLKSLLLKQPDIHLYVFKDTEHFVKEYPNGVDELCLQAKGEIKDIHRLRELYELFGETLDQLHRIGSVSENKPGISF